MEIIWMLNGWWFLLDIIYIYHDCSICFGVDDMMRYYFCGECYEMSWYEMEMRWWHALHSCCMLIICMIGWHETGPIWTVGMKQGQSEKGTVGMKQGQSERGSNEPSNIGPTLTTARSCGWLHNHCIEHCIGTLHWCNLYICEILVEVVRWIVVR